MSHFKPKPSGPDIVDVIFALTICACVLKHCGVFG